MQTIFQAMIISIFGTFKEKLQIQSDHEIFKVGNRVFQYDFINTDFIFVSDLISILDLGLKFVPFFFYSPFQLFSFFLKHVEMELVNFNKKLSFHKWSVKNNDKNKSSVSRVTNNYNLNEPINSINSHAVNDIHVENLDNLDDDNININFDHIFKKFQKKKPSFNFKNNFENFEFKYTFYDYLSNIEFNSSYNLSVNQIKTLRLFVKTKPFSVIECDKNVGTMLISNENLKSLCIDHLSNNLIYKEVDENPLLATTDLINRELMNLYSNLLISDKVYKVLQIVNPVIGKFRVLAKVHKNKFGIRPIINSTNTPTYNLCKLVEYILSPFVKEFSSFIQDSQNLIQDLDNKHFPPNVKLLSADIEALYTNIN